jgi:hypothetical protein
LLRDHLARLKCGRYRHCFLAGNQIVEVDPDTLEIVAVLPA